MRQLIFFFFFVAVGLAGGGFGLVNVERDGGDEDEVVASCVQENL